MAGNPNAGAAEINLLEDEILDLLEGRLGFGAFYRASWAFDVGELLSQLRLDHGRAVPRRLRQP